MPFQADQTGRVFCCPHLGNVEEIDHDSDLPGM
jgi:hypothetical protein